MTLRIERSTKQETTLIRLIGRLGVEHLEELRTQIADSDLVPVLDLEEVDLIDVEGVRFLISLQKDGIDIRNASPYIREWMNRVRGNKP
jgi:anti-anti-sigma regulatory factor